RYDHTAVWSGTQMIVWGGCCDNFGDEFNTGGRYCAAAPSSTPTPTSSPTPTATATSTATATATPTATPTATVRPTPTPRIAPTPRARPTPHRDHSGPTDASCCRSRYRPEANAAAGRHPYG